MFWREHALSTDSRCCWGYVLDYRLWKPVARGPAGDLPGCISTTNSTARTQSTAYQAERDQRQCNEISHAPRDCAACFCRVGAVVTKYVPAVWTGVARIYVVRARKTAFWCEGSGV